jgi:hypothetical protein
MRLTEAQVMCGLSLPRSKHMLHTDIFATTETAELLTPLANYDLLAEKKEETTESDSKNVEFLPSNFDVQSLIRATQNAGKTYYIARDAKGLRTRGLPQGLDKTKLIMLTYEEVSDEDIYALDVKCMKLRRGAMETIDG